MSGRLDLVRRAELVEAAIARFGTQPFGFGKADCGQMVISHLKAMGWRIRTGGTWKNQRELRRFLNRNGGSGAAVLDKWGVPRIPPACAVVGDIVEMAGEPPFGCFALVLGNGRVVGWHQDHDVLTVYQLAAPPIAAWRT